MRKHAMQFLLIECQALPISAVNHHNDNLLEIERYSFMNSLRHHNDQDNIIKACKYSYTSLSLHKYSNHVLHNTIHISKEHRLKTHTSVLQ